jgi:hypothetical protein
MEGLRKLVSALVVLAAGVIWATHAHSAATIVGNGQMMAMIGDPMHIAAVQVPAPR